MNLSMEFSRKVALAYGGACKPLCRELSLPQTAFDILLFLANNPSYSTAADIVEIRKIKANLVSVNVDKLVRDGYLTRQAVAGDRRKTRLCCTEKAQPIIRQGRQLQEAFLERLFRGIDAGTKAAFLKTLTMMNDNLDELLKENEAYGSVIYRP